MIKDIIKKWLGIKTSIPYYFTKFVVHLTSGMDDVSNPDSSIQYRNGKITYKAIADDPLITPETILRSGLYTEQYFINNRWDRDVNKSWYHTIRAIDPKDISSIVITKENGNTYIEFPIEYIYSGANYKEPALPMPNEYGNHLSFIQYEADNINQNVVYEIILICQ